MKDFACAYSRVLYLTLFEVYISWGFLCDTSLNQLARVNVGIKSIGSSKNCITRTYKVSWLQRANLKIPRNLKTPIRYSCLIIYYSLAFMLVVKIIKSKRHTTVILKAVCSVGVVPNLAHYYIGLFITWTILLRSLVFGLDPVTSVREGLDAGCINNLSFPTCSYFSYI